MGTIEKRNQIERLSVACALIDSVYEEIIAGKADVRELQQSLTIQAEVNRMFYELTELMRGGVCKDEKDISGRG